MSNIFYKKEASLSSKEIQEDDRASRECPSPQGGSDNVGGGDHPRKRKFESQGEGGPLGELHGSRKVSKTPDVSPNRARDNATVGTCSGGAQTLTVPG